MILLSVKTRVKEALKGLVGGPAFTNGEGRTGGPYLTRVRERA